MSTIRVLPKNTKAAAAPFRKQPPLSLFILVNRMFIKRFNQRTVFIRRPDQKRLAAFRWNRCERPHVFDDDVALAVVQLEPRLGVFQRRAGMGKTMQTLPVAFFMPIV